MPDIQTLLREYGEHLDELAPVIDVNELEHGLVVPGRPSRWWHRPSIVVAAAAIVVLVVVGGLSILFAPDSEPPAEATTIPGPTVPTTFAGTTPEPTTPSLFFPTPPTVSDPIQLDPDQERLVGVWIAVAIDHGVSNLSVYLGEYQDTAVFSSVPPSSNELFAFTTEADATEFMAARMLEELAEELTPIALGEESVSYIGSFGRGGQATVHLIRVGRLVLSTFVNDDFDIEEVSGVVAAMESSFSPSLSAYHGPVSAVDTSDSTAIQTISSFGAWRLPVGDVAGEPAELSFGYERDGQGSCTYWFGDVEPHEYITYTPTGNTVTVLVRDVAQEPVEESEVGIDDAGFIAAEEACNRFPPLAGEWGLGAFVSSEPEYSEDYRVYQSGEDEFVLVAPHTGWAVSEGEVGFDQLELFDLPPDVIVTESNIRVGGDGFVSIGVEFEGPRSSIEEMLGIDLGAMPDERIGVSFGFESGSWLG